MNRPCRDENRAQTPGRFHDKIRKLRTDRPSNLTPNIVKTMFSTPLRRPSITTVLSWLIILLPLGVYLAYLPDFGELQNNDYYHVLSRVVDSDGPKPGLEPWLQVTANEHLATVPALLYTANALWNHGNNRGLTLFALAMMAASFALLYRLLPRRIRRSPWARLLFATHLAVFIFTPVAGHNVAMGFSGTQWFLANALAMLAISLVVSRAGREGRPWIYPVLVLIGGVGALTYSTHLAVWPALLFGALVLRRPKAQIASLVVCSAVIYGFYSQRYHTPSHHPAPNTTDFGTLLSYIGTYLGSTFSGRLEIARLVGWTGLLATIGIWISTLIPAPRATRIEAAPWMMIGLYGLVNAVGTAVGRSGMGIEQALASRYASLPGFFWLSSGVLGVLLWQRRQLPLPHRKWMVAICLGGWLLLVHASYKRGVVVLDSFASRASLQRIATLAMRRGYPDVDIVRRCVTPDIPTLVRQLRALRILRHVPFDQKLPPLLPRQVASDRLSSEPHPEARGFFQDLQILPDHPMVRVEGWAWNAKAPVMEVLLIDSQGNVRGELLTGIHRAWEARTFGPSALTSGWAGYVNGDLLVRQLDVYIRVAGDRRFYPLPRTQNLRDKVRILSQRSARANPR